MKYTEVRGNLFNAEEHYILAHCIAADARMGAGIATQFVRKYPNMRGYIQSKSPSVGDVIFYNHYQSGDRGKHHVLNLITKEKSHGKPTRENFNLTITKLKEEMIVRDFYHLAIPLIGSGLDRLSWSVTKEFIMKEFADTDIEIVVYRL